MIYRKYVKPFFDVVFAAIALLLLSPFFVLLSIAGFFIYQQSPYFFQKRAGKNGVAFTVFKLKSMKNGTINAYGNFIRKYGIDELPQVINILMGEMSFVGPRPLLWEYVNLYDNFQKQRLFVKPGITGWAQVNGRNEISWEQKFDLDIWYINHLSLYIDLKILLKSIFLIINKNNSGKPSNEFQHTK